jgi:hypothetical protein
MTLGFALLTHQLPDQAMRLASTLDRMFPGAPIVIHHDFSKCEFPSHGWPPGVSFVRPHLLTRWGGISLVDASVAALKQLARNLAGDSWLVLLSGADYPIATADRILADYASISEDALVDYREITYQGYLRSSVPDGKTSFDSNEFQQVAYDRYMAIRIPYPDWRRPWVPKAAGAFFIRNPRIVSRLTHFQGSARCFSGSTWFSIRAGALLRLLESPAYARWHRHSEKRHIPDEALIQTALLNAPEFSVNRNNFRFIDWSHGGHHPKLLSVDDIGSMWSSGAHFARKFPHASPALDELDRLILGESATARA